MKKLISSFAILLTLLLTPLAAQASWGIWNKSSKYENFDVQFVDTMIEHNRQGIEMFKIAAVKAKNVSVRTKAQELRRKMEDGTTKLESLRDEVASNANKSVNMDLPGMKNLDLSELVKASKDDFDKEFLDMAIDHLQGAVKLAETALEESNNPKIKEKARLIISNKNEEIEQVKKLENGING